MIVTLTTDFGDSAYAGALRGSVLQVAPDAHVVDITHAVPAHDVMQGALALRAAAPYFPRGSVHICVVDPGVGTARRPLMVEADGAIFIGPDNGVLVPAAERMGLRRSLVLDKTKFWRARPSHVFHGRDVFGPVAGHLARGARPDELATEVKDAVRLDFGTPGRETDGWVRARILAVDAFGNLTTNVPEWEAPPRGTRVEVDANGQKGSVPTLASYGEAPRGGDALLCGSSGYVELAVNRGRADTRWGVKPGQELRFRW